MKRIWEVIKDKWNETEAVEIFIMTAIAAIIIMLVVLIWDVSRNMKDDVTPALQGNGKIIDMSSDIILWRVTDKETNVTCYIYRPMGRAERTIQCVHVPEGR